jgi:long-chain acyl-CoA synthetase
VTVEHTAHGDVPTEPPVAAMRAAARFSKSLEVALSDVNLSLPQYRLLAFLSGGPERATALAGWLDVSPPSLTALVDGCVARGLVERVTSAEDRRRVLHEITDQGHTLLKQADVVAAGRLAEVTSELSPAQARKVIEGLELLGRALDEARARRDAQPKTAAGAAS